MDATKWHRRVLSVLFIVYLILLFYFLFFSEGFGRTQFGEEYRYNLTLFKEITRFIRYRHLLGFKAVFINIAGNVIAFMPLGFFLPTLHPKKRNGIVVVIHCFLLSLLVEVIHTKRGIVATKLALVLLVLYLVILELAFRANGGLSAYYGSIGVLAMLASVVVVVVAAGSLREEDSFRLFPRLGLFLSVVNIVCWAGTYVMGFVI